MYYISVIIPTYNRGQLIKKSIESVLLQQDQGELFEISEVIVIDDGSTDDTETIIRGIEDSRISYNRLSENSGASRARNTGVELSKGEWIAFQDSDDVWHADKLKKQVEFLNVHTDICMVSHPILAIFDDGSGIRTETINCDDPVLFLAKRNYYDTPTMLVDKNAFHETGGFNEELKALEDWDLAIRLADIYKIGMVDEVLIDSQMLAGGVSSGAANYYESRCEMIARNKDILMRHGCFDDAVKSLLQHAQNNGVLDMVGKMLELKLRVIDDL